MKTLPDAALAYPRDDGLPVFPCLPKDKPPAVSNGFHAATRNPETIKRLWRIADRNIGIPTGMISGFWVLDIDGENGEASLADLEQRHGRLPATAEVITGNGRHLWFACSGPIPSTTKRIGAGLDTKGDGGYVLVPPSVHPSGAVYVWRRRDHLAPAPAWLLRLVRTKPHPPITGRAHAATGPLGGQSSAYGLAALDRETAALAAVSPGLRNYALNSASFRLFQLVAGGELDADQVAERLVAACHRNGLVADDGLRSVLATIRSGSLAGLQHPRSRRSTP
jgi:putative DNA primase/helicase